MVVAGRRNPPRSGDPAAGRLAAGMRRLVPGALRRDPDDRWAAVFGRIAGYSFAVAVVSGVLLLPFFRSSMATVAYHGSYGKLDGLPVSQAYQSVLAISFDVRGGLLIRQVHHWSADLFVAAICLRLLRVFFRGRFCGRALPGWLIWVTLLPVGMLAAYTGTILPDDGLSGGSLAVITGVLLSLPLIGTHLVFWIFGGAPPGHQIIGRDYWVHILVLPALAGALLLASFRPPLRWPRRVRPDPLLLFTCAVLVLLGAIAQINPVWLYGPYQPGSISSGAVPDWYMGFLDGALRLMPAWELTVAGHPLDLGVLIPALVLPGLFFTCLSFACLALYPLADRQIAGGRPPRGLLPPRACRPGQPHRDRHRQRHAVRAAVGRGSQRPDRLPPADPSVHGHLDIPGARAGRADAGVDVHPGHLPRAGRPATQRGTARPGNRADREEPARRLHRNPRASPPGSAAYRQSARHRRPPARSWKEARCHGQVELDRCRHTHRDSDCPVHGHSPAFRRGQPFRAQPCRAAAGIRRCAGADRCRRAEGQAAETPRS